MTANLGSRGRGAIVPLVVIAVLLVAAVAYAVNRRTAPEGAIAIAGAGPAPFPRRVLAPVSWSTDPIPPPRHRYITSISANGRYFVDQTGAPILVRGDSPWSLLSDLSTAQATTYFADRAGHGINAMIMSLVGAVANGGPSDDGSTYDGVRPFPGGDPTRFNRAYFDRAHATVKAAAARGITVFLYPIDVWMLGKAFAPTTTGQCRTYGAYVARKFADLPNIIWMSGGDYIPRSDTDRCIAQMVAGIRSTHDNRPFSVQVGFGQPPSWTTASSYWASRADFDFVYTYTPTHAAVRSAIAGHRRSMPAILGEANYEGEDNHGGPATTDQTLRRQAAWALTSGAAGDFYGSNDWEFLPGWQRRLDSRGIVQVSRIRRVVAGLRWWALRPMDSFIASGRGTDTGQDVLQSSVATAAVSGDRRTALVYVPTARTITLRVGRLAKATHARWVDPASGASRNAGPGPRFRTPGVNADGDSDWLLAFAP